MEFYKKIMKDYVESLKNKRWVEAPRDERGFCTWCCGTNIAFGQSKSCQHGKYIEAKP